jgi:hypothetical protein
LRKVREELANEFARSRDPEGWTISSSDQSDADDIVDRVRNAVLDEVIQQLDEQMPCHCIDAYKDRGLIDPQCERHDFATLVEDMKNG